MIAAATFPEKHYIFVDLYAQFFQKCNVSLNSILILPGNRSIIIKRLGLGTGWIDNRCIYVSPEPNDDHGKMKMRQTALSG